jgi:hypothetical protein
LVALTSLATRRIDAISTSEDGKTLLSKMDSSRLPMVCVCRMRLLMEGAAGDGKGAGEDEDMTAVLCGNS